MSQGNRKELEFSMESRIGFIGKVSDQRVIEVIMEGKVGNIERTIGDFADDTRLEGMNYFYIS